MKGFLSNIKQWFIEAARSMRREFYTVFHDVGAMIFFFGLPLAYPVIYSLIYNPEVVREMPVAVVDNNRSAMSREFIRHADATEAIKIIGYASDKEEARRWLNEKKCIAVFEIPADYTQHVARGEQGQIQFYCEMSLLLRYRAFVAALADLQMNTDAQLRTTALDNYGVSSLMSNQGIGIESYMLGDTQQGFASFIMPGIVVLILQQAMLLGITMLGGTWREQRRRLKGYDPATSTPAPSAMVIGKMLCYVTIMLPPALYVLHFIPEFFAFPHIGNLLQELLFIIPMLVASAFLGMTLISITTEREASFIVVVFTSIVFLFISGLTWPRYAMPDIWKWAGNMIPCVWGLEGFIRIDSNGASLAQQATPYYWMWGLAAFYFITAWITFAVLTRPSKKALSK